MRTLKNADVLLPIPSAVQLAKMITKKGPDAMDKILMHVSENFESYYLMLGVIGVVCVAILSKYFATKKDLAAHTLVVQQRFETNENKFKNHQLEHYKLRDTVNELDKHIKCLPTSQDSQALRESMARLEGRLESVEPMFKQILNQYNMLLENELRGEKK
jgi:hypothetical protein